MSAFASGTGQGTITDDGCAVEVYTRLPVGTEPDTIDSAISPGSRILELGAGTGRVTHQLIAKGHRVTAVDSSPEMLSHITGARTVVGDASDLRLDEEFDAVVLGSHFINIPDADARRRFLRSCRRHVRSDGSVLIEHHPPQWFSTVAPFEITEDGITYRLRDIHHPSDDSMVATMEYVIAGRTWTHSFQVTLLREDDLVATLRQCGLDLAEYVSADGSWIRAVPLPATDE